MKRVGALVFSNIADSLDRQAARQPYAPAFVSKAGVTHYRTLNEMVWRAVGWLSAAGIRADDTKSAAGTSDTNGCQNML